MTDNGKPRRGRSFSHPTSLGTIPVPEGDDPEHLGRRRAFLEQCKTNNDRIEHNDPIIQPQEQIVAQKSAVTGMQSTYQSSKIKKENEHESSLDMTSEVVKQEETSEIPPDGDISSNIKREAVIGDFQQDPLNSVRDLQSGNAIPSQALHSLENDLDRLSFEQNNLNRNSSALNTDRQLAKRSADDLMHDTRAPSPSKLRRTTVDNNATALQHSKRFPSLARKSNPNLRRNPIGLNPRRRWSAKVLASQTAPNANVPLQIGQSLSDPPLTQAGPEDSTSLTDSQQPSRRNSNTSEVVSEFPHSSIVRQPDSKPIAENQLSAEIKAIYSGLVMVESRCISVDNAESARLQEIRSGKKPKSSLANNLNQWPAVISLHRALLQEHHDFFLASQHPAASEPIRKLAEKYSMAERLWKHGIRSPLELFRFGLPYSKEFMISFIILSYQMICLLYETVRSFKDTWIECLGDLARYRMAVEDEDPKDREIWSNVSRAWYFKASIRQPRIGRLYHHQAILARTNPLQQLCFYARALNAVHPFVNARESITALFDPTLSRLHLPGTNKMTFDSHFNRLQAMLFTERHLTTDYNDTLKSFLSGLDGMIAQAGRAFRIQGEYISNILIADLSKFGAYGDPIRLLLTKDNNRPQNPSPNFLASTRTRLSREWNLAFEILKICLGRPTDENILPLLLTFISFLTVIVSAPHGMEYVDDTIPIEKIVECGNSFIEDFTKNPLTDDVKQHSERLVLDTMHGQLWADNLIPKDTIPRVEDYDDAQIAHDYPDPTLQRYNIVSSIRKMASFKPTTGSVHKKWLTFDDSARVFKTNFYGESSSPPMTSSKIASGFVKIVGDDASAEDIV